MRIEDQAGIQLVLKGDLGAVTFFRYSLTLKGQAQDQDPLLSDVFDWIKAAGVTELESVSASYGKGKQVLIVTMAFSNNVLANICLNMTGKGLGYIKKIELVGTEGLYVFDSESESAFTSDCVVLANYDLITVNPLNQPWLNLINTSLISGEMEVVK